MDTFGDEPRLDNTGIECLECRHPRVTRNKEQPGGGKDGGKTVASSISRTTEQAGRGISCKLQKEERW